MSNDDLASVLTATHELLLDFDGPITPLLPAREGAALANDARHVLISAGIDLPSPLATTTDHLSVLRYGAEAATADVLNEVEEVCLLGEIEAARRSEPTPGGHSTLVAAHNADRPVAIVSNNAAAAIEAYLERNEVRSLVGSIVGREHRRPDLMKPNVEPILRALRAIGARPESCAFIGDSVTDIEVSRQARTRSIGYAKTPARGRELATAGADALVDHMATIASTLAGR